MKKQSIYVLTVMSVLFFGLAFLCWFKKSDAYSDSERRFLAEFPKLTASRIETGKFMSEFETYTQDQFPYRDSFRTLKATAQLDIFKQKDNNDIYKIGDVISKMEYPLKENMLDIAADKFKYLYDTYMASEQITPYFCIVPDKNYVLAEQNGYLSMDYDALFLRMQEKTSYMKFIDIRDLLSAEDYYRTDTHWKQEQVLDVAAYIAAAMGNTLSWEYEQITAEQPFYGVYSGQSALDVKPDEIVYLTNEALQQCSVTSYDTGTAVTKYMYDLEKLDGKDPYEMFLSGSDALLVVENPNANTEKELIVFRDSFGSSLLPLMIESYQKVTIVDIRYINSSILGQFIDFKDQDVLFLYSTLLLNNSTAFK